MTDRYRLEGVVRRYRHSRSGQWVEALRVDRLQIAAGEIVAVVGPNGAGKSTLLETLAFLARPEEGRVLLDGADVWNRGGALAARRRCPMLLQRPVLFRTSVLKNVVYGLRMRRMRRGEAAAHAQSVLRLLGLDDLALRNWRELSGGERQRVALARVLALQPDVLLLDEPTAHVDQSSERQVEGVLRDLHAKNGMTIVMASHSPEQALRLADRTITILDGRVYCGTVENLVSGTIESKQGQPAFRAQGGWTIPIGADTLVSDSDSRMPLPGVAVRISLDGTRLGLRPGGAAATRGLAGRISAVEQIEAGGAGDREVRCRLVVRLGDDCQLRAELPWTEFQARGLTVGMQVDIELGPAAVRIVGATS